MTSADAQVIGRIHFQKHVPRAGNFEVYSGIIYSYTVVGLCVTSIASIALNLNNDWSHVSTAYVQAKSLKNRFDFCMQIVLSQQKCPLPSLAIN